MDEVTTIYNNCKLLVRAMDYPQFQRGVNGLEYNCTEWANEFCLMMNDKLYSASSTLIVPNVGVTTYKSIGYLIDSDKVECHHISKRDSGSSGSVINGDFSSNESDCDTLQELANYITTSKDNIMNEVNINASIDSVVGLFFNECPRQDLLLQMTYLAKRCLKSITGIDYPIYSYNLYNGSLSYVEITKELEEQIINGLRTNRMMYWPDSYDEEVDEIIECDLKQRL